MGRVEWPEGGNTIQVNIQTRYKHVVYVDEVSCGQKRSFQSVPKGSQEVDLLNRRGAP